MKYVKAQDVFPQALLDEIQKYVQGDLVYIPKPPGSHKKWGADTDTKAATAQRNEEILRAFAAGFPVSELAEAYYLSEETIKKIVYRKK
jgi:DNA-binding NarL/FixJ family response regulator